LIEFQDGDYLWDSKTGDMYDKDIFEETDELMWVNHYLSDDDDDE
jgi:hypothetical protein